MTFSDGESKILAKVRGEKNIIPAILEQVKPFIDPDAPYFCINGALAAENDRILGRDPELCYYIGGVIAINAGPNLVGIVCRRRTAGS